ncbi:MAG: hypothetical protein QNJ16_15240 [Rhodobacter sp.]|nr:hypothetical protein [Rhodobacter sp.]
MTRPKRNGPALSKKRVLGASACVLALTAAQNQANPFLGDLTPLAKPAKPEVGRSFDNPAGDFAGLDAPLDRHPIRVISVDTANQLKEGEVNLGVGWHQNDPGTAAGTGNQIYDWHGDWGVRDRFQAGFTFQSYNDPFHKPINGATSRLKFLTYGVSGKFKVYETPRLSFGVQGSVEYMTWESPLWGSDVANADHVIGSVQAPVTFRFSPQFELHLTPGVSIFPDSINGFDFFGTVGYIGAGATWKPHERVTAYGMVNVPVSGTNNITNTQTLDDTPIWTVGGRYNVTPKVAVDLYATNGLGTSPATGILGYPPDAETVLYGIQLNWTPGAGKGYRSTYRAGPPKPATARSRSLEQAGFTLGTGRTLSPGTLMGVAAYGTDDGFTAAAHLSPDQDFEFGGLIERFANDGSVGAPLVDNINDKRFLYFAKLRVLDQDYGDPVSMAVEVSAGRDLASGPNTGTLTLGAPISYDFNDRFTVNVNPRAAAQGNSQTYGLGLGVNYEVLPGLEAIAEVTPVVDGNGTVWAAGARYNVPDWDFSVDLHATNAIGRYGQGTLIAQDDVRYVLGASLKLDLSGWR